MAKWASAAFLDGGLTYLKTTATHLVLLKAYAAGDSFATVAGNTIADIAMVTGDFTISSNGSNRQVVTGAKTGTASASSGATPNLHLALTDGANVIWVTDETSDQVVTSGNSINVPALTYTANQPV